MITLKTLKALDLHTEKDSSLRNIELSFIYIEIVNEHYWSMIAADGHTLLKICDLSDNDWYDLCDVIYEEFNFDLPRFPTAGYLTINKKKIKDEKPFIIEGTKGFKPFPKYQNLIPIESSREDEHIYYSFDTMNKIHKTFKYLGYKNITYNPNIVNGKVGATRLDIPNLMREVILVAMPVRPVWEQ